MPEHEELKLLQGLQLRLQLEGWGVALHLSTGASVRSQVYEYARRRYLAFMRASHSGGTHAHTPRPLKPGSCTHALKARVPYTRPTPSSHPPKRSHTPTCTRPNHTHMIVICRRTHPSHHHTPTRTCPGVNGHTLTPMAAGCRAQPAGFGSYAVTCGSAAIRSLQRMAAAR